MPRLPFACLLAFPLSLTLAGCNAPRPDFDAGLLNRDVVLDNGDATPPEDVQVAPDTRPIGCLNSGASCDRNESCCNMYCNLGTHRCN